MIMRTLQIAACALALTSAAFAESTVSRFEAADIEGTVRTLRSSPDQKATVLFFILPDCPISNAYAPEIKRIAADYARRDIDAWIVYVDPDLSIEAARKHAKSYDFVGPLFVDTSLTIATRAGAKIAPEVAVLAPNGERLYLGRIDNLYADYGKRKVKPSQRDLRDALDAILQGKPVPSETTKAIGCFIAKPVTKPQITE